MPISVGEVNAALKFMVYSDDLRVAQANLRELAADFREAGGAASTSGRQIQAEMTAAAREIQQLKRDVLEADIALSEMETKGGLRELKQQADAANQSFDQLQMLALRMGERLLLLYAFKASFDFVKGLYDAADALVTLSDRTGMSISRLQELEQVGEQNSVSTKDLSSAIKDLDKNMDEMKGGDALKEIGLSFGQIFAMNPDERFTQIALRIGEIPSAAQRSKIEIQLFGSDAVDPLIVKMFQLGGNLKDVSNIMSETQVRALSDAKRSYVEFGTILEGFGAKILEVGSKQTALIASPFFIFAKEGFPGLLTAMKNADMFADSLDHVSESAKKIPPIPPLMGQAFIDSLKAQIPLTKEQTAALDQLRAMGELTYQNAVKATGQNQISEAQYKAYEKSVKDAAAAEREHEAEIRKSEEAYKHFQQVIDEVLSAGKSWKGTVAGMNSELHEHVKSLLEAGVGEKAIAEWTGATATQIHAVVKELKDEADARALVARTAEAQAKVMAKLHEIRADDEASDLQKHLNANERKYEDDVATAKKRGIVDASYYAALAALRNAEDAQATKQLSDRTEFSREHYKKEYDNAYDFYQALVQNAADHNQQEIEDARRAMEEKRKIYLNWRDQSIKDYAAVGAAASGFVTDFVDGLGFLGQNLDDTRVKVRLLDGEIVSLKEAVDRFNAGNTITYDLTTTAGVEQYRKMNPGAQISLSDAQIISMVSAGATLQSLIQAGYINPYAGMAQAYGGFTGRPTASGNTMASGTMPTSPLVTPGAGSGSPLASGLPPETVGTQITNMFHVNGTAEEVAAKIADKIKTQLFAKATLTRKFGTAS